MSRARLGGRAGCIGPGAVSSASPDAFVDPGVLLIRGGDARRRTLMPRLSLIGHERADEGDRRESHSNDLGSPVDR